MSRPARPHPFQPTVTLYRDANGKRCRSTDPGATKETTRTLTWYADIPGLGRTSLKTMDESEAWDVLKKILKEQHERRLGIHDEYTDHAATELERHIDEWSRILEAKGTQPQSVDWNTSHVRKIAELAGWKRLPHITHDSALVALSKVQMRTKDGGLGHSARTRNHYLSHLKAFCRWAHNGGRLKRNPVADIKPISVEADKRHARREPSAEEIAELCRWLDSDEAPDSRRLSPRERRLGYLVSMCTGFRAGELRALTKASFDLKAGTVTVPAGYSKRRRTDTQRLPPWLVEELRDWFRHKGGWRWHNLPKQGPGRMLVQDLEAARLAWIEAAEDNTERQQRETSDFLRYRVDLPDGPRFFDYHSWRHRFNSRVANTPGMDLKTLLTLTRLSSAELALRTYAHSDEAKLQAAAESIPPPASPA